MDIALAILGGMLCKIYDDFSDSKIVTNPLVLECLKGLQWISLCLLSYKDFNLFGESFELNKQPHRMDSSIRAFVVNRLPDIPDNVLYNLSISQHLRPNFIIFHLCRNVL